MTDQQITALAREYAEEMKHLLPDMSEHTYRDKIWQAKNVLNIVMRRFCLVEKSKVKEEYDEARIFCENVDPCGESYARNEAQMFLLERLFPEIAKEVEE